MKLPKVLNKLKEKEYEEPKYEQQDKEVVKNEVVKEEVVEGEKRRIVIVKEIPTQPLREVKLDDGTIADLYTTEEYLTKLANEGED